MRNFCKRKKGRSDGIGMEPKIKTNHRFMTRKQILSKLHAEQKRRHDHKVKLEKMEEELFEMEDQDHLDLSEMIREVEKKDVPEDMLLLWEEQRKIMETACASIEDVPTHVIDFKFVPRELLQVTKVSSLQKLTGSMPLSVCGKHISEIEEGKFYSISNCRLRHFYGKCLATTRSTVITSAEARDVTKAVEQRQNNLLCCPGILNVHVDSFLACNSKACKKRINGTPGCKIVKCHYNRSMLIKNCYADMTVHFKLEKEDKIYSVAAFPKALSAFLQKDVISFKDDTDTLTAELLVLENVDFQLSQIGKLITKMNSHTSTGNV
ncbi:hypothetical protein ACROYT_G014672 [Oculina patagonica]